MGTGSSLSCSSSGNVPSRNQRRAAQSLASCTGDQSSSCHLALVGHGSGVRGYLGMNQWMEALSLLLSFCMHLCLSSKHRRIPFLSHRLDRRELSGQVPAWHLQALSPEACVPDQGALLQFCLFCNDGLLKEEVTGAPGIGPSFLDIWWGGPSFSLVSISSPCHSGFQSE